ncbi:carbonic anhydrase [Acuticoccus kandeliae]|uniref:carbonic anhydrase n=1 Tax=Acuticoccus kandeliae TaxID=2073160 RepID=UPI000D3EC636|nr:carbonic anhydrase [Acuticoccus kandeliae]
MCNDHPTDLTRRVLLGTGALAASAAFTGGFVTPAAAQSSTSAPNAISPSEALQRLVDGNERYVNNVSRNVDFSADRVSRAAAQYPFAGFVSCADSRIAPELAFDQGPGEVFVVRLAGNFVDENGLASIEFGVAVLGIPLLVVLGHSGCGAIAATIDVIENGTELPGHLPGLVNALKPGVEKALAEKPEDALKAATAENVRYNVERLKTATPIVADAVAAGTVQVVGGVYDIATGKVELL